MTKKRVDNNATNLTVKVEEKDSNDGHHHYYIKTSPNIPPLGEPRSEFNIYKIQISPDAIYNNNNKEEEHIAQAHKMSYNLPIDGNLPIDHICVKKSIIVDSIVYYDIHVKNSQQSWITTKRYNQFEELHYQLINENITRLPLFPPKYSKCFTDHIDKQFVETRRALLDNYMKKLIKHKETNSCRYVIDFLCQKQQKKGVLPIHHVMIDNNSNNNDNNNNNAEDRHDDRGHDDDEDRHDGQAHYYHDDDESDRFPDDQKVTKITIDKCKYMNGYMLYQIQVENSKKNLSWIILKRFAQFHIMDEKLRKDIKANCPYLLDQLPSPLPRKNRWFHDHMNDDDFIEQRRILMQNYLQKLIKFPQIANNQHLLEFFGCWVT